MSDNVFSMEKATEKVFHIIWKIHPNMIYKFDRFCALTKMKLNKKKNKTTTMSIGNANPMPLHSYYYEIFIYDIHKILLLYIENFVNSFRSETS